MAAIRKAVTDDVFDILLLAEEFAAAHSDFKIKVDDTEHMIRGCISDGVAYVADSSGILTGAIIGMVGEHPFLDCTILTELGWYSSNRSGARLLAAFITEGKLRGVDLITASTLDTSPDAANTLMQYCGMSRREVVWQMKM